MGGQAYLSLENSEDPFLNGIKFTAMPPSKRFREMEQLSGGEKVKKALCPCQESYLAMLSCIHCGPAESPACTYLAHHELESVQIVVDIDIDIDFCLKDRRIVKAQHAMHICGHAVRCGLSFLSCWCLFFWH